MRLKEEIKQQKRGKMKNRSRIVYFLQEIAIVVIGVLIAVSISNYKENINNKAYIQKTLLAMESEIKLSQSSVDSVLTRHFTLIDSLENSIYDDERALGEMISNFGGVQFPLIKNVSLRFFISNKAELVDFDMISQLLEIEEHTKVLSDKMKRLGDFAYDRLNNRAEETKLTFAYLLSDVMDSEEALLESYSKFLDENKDDLKQDAK